MIQIEHVRTAECHSRCVTSKSKEREKRPICMQACQDTCSDAGISRGPHNVKGMHDRLIYFTMRGYKRR